MWQKKLDDVAKYQQKIQELKVFLGNKEEEFKVELPTSSMKVQITQEKPTTTKVETAKAEPNPIKSEILPKIEVETVEKLWFFSNGTKYPEPAKVDNQNRRIAKLFPEEDIDEDRIVNQLMFVPPNYEEVKKSGKLKKVLIYSGDFGVQTGERNRTEIRRMESSVIKTILGRTEFISCPVDTCEITRNKNEINGSDLVIFRDGYVDTNVAKSPKQLYMIYMLESPYHTGNFGGGNLQSVFNWTATYR
jgi:glycoprotein 3-alpha-L-fucosyltransferase